MSQPYHLPDSSLGSSSTPQTVPIGMAGTTNTQTTAMENSSAEHFRVGDERPNLTTTGADYAVQFSAGENDGWTQDARNETIPGYRGMVSR